MGENDSKGNREEVLQELKEDPTRSIREISAEMGTYRQLVWRKKKQLEKEHVVWGYTAVVDESKLGHVMYIILMKMKPMSKELVDILVQRVQSKVPESKGVNIINVSYVNGEYDWIIKFSAPDHTIARKYYDTLRIVYEEHLLEKPAIIDINFTVKRQGKVNPELEELYHFIP